MNDGAIGRSDIHRALFISSGDNIIYLGFIKCSIAHRARQFNILEGGNIDIGASRSGTNEFNINGIIRLDAGIVGF